MSPTWMKSIATAITTAAMAITAALAAIRNITETAEHYTAVYKTKAIQDLAKVKLDDEPATEE